MMLRVLVSIELKRSIISLRKHQSKLETESTSTLRRNLTKPNFESPSTLRQLID